MTIIELSTGLKVNRNSIYIGGIDKRDYPDFCDAYVEEAYDIEGNALTCEQIEQLEEDYPEIASEIILER